MVKFYKIRALLFLWVIKLLSKIFVVEVPPIVSVAALVEKDGKFLFLKFSYLKGYGLPGGIVKKDEEIEAALKREVAEETGLKVTGHKYIGSVSSYTRKIPTICMFFKAEIAGEIKESEEGTLHWLVPTQDVLDTMAYENNKIGLSRYLKESQR